MFSVASSDEEWAALLANNASVVCRNAADVIEAIASGNTPLSNVPGKVLAQFVDGLVWAPQGLAGADFSMLVGILSDNEIDDVFTIFGIGKAMLEDHKKYRCAGPGDCASEESHICTSNCIDAYTTNFNRKRKFG